MELAMLPSMPQGTPGWLTFGWIIAFLVLILAVVFTAVGRLDLLEGCLIGGVALSRIIP